MKECRPSRHKSDYWMLKEKGRTGWDHLSLKTNTCPPSKTPPPVLSHCPSIRTVHSSHRWLNSFPGTSAAPAASAAASHFFRQNSTFDSWSIFSPLAFALCQVWRTFRLTCSNSLTRLPVPGYPIRPWLTGLSSLARANQFTSSTSVLDHPYLLLIPDEKNIEKKNHKQTKKNKRRLGVNVQTHHESYLKDVILNIFYLLR